MKQENNKIPLEIRLKSDLEKLENRYSYLLKNASWLYRRNLQVIQAIILTCISISWFFVVKEWYAYALCCASLFFNWYILFLTEKMRRAMKWENKDHKSFTILDHMYLRRQILDQLAQIRITTIISSILLLLLVWILKSPEKRFETTSISTVSVICVMAFFAWLATRKKLSTTRTYLDNIIKVLEQK